MIREVTCYQAVCDGCGNVDDEGDYSVWSDAGTAQEVALASEWVEVDGKLFCPNCEPTEKEGGGRRGVSYESMRFYERFDWRPMRFDEVRTDDVIANGASVTTSRKARKDDWPSFDHAGKWFIREGSSSSRMATPDSILIVGRRRFAPPPAEPVEGAEG